MTRRGLLLLLSLLPLLASCQNRPGPTYTHEVITDTAYYLGGPQQSRPPEGTLSAGTLLNVIQESGSYSLIASEHHVTAYVATAAIQRRESLR